MKIKLPKMKIKLPKTRVPRLPKDFGLMLVLSPMFVVYALVYFLMMALITLVFLTEVSYLTAAYPFIRLANKLSPNFVLNEYGAVVEETYQKYIRARGKINSLL
jgi:hypothetical protein